MRFLTLFIFNLVLLQPFAQTPCGNGLAGAYPCDQIDLLSFTPLSELGNPAIANDIWGWTDALDGKEYVLIGLSTGTGFLDISDPVNPVFLGALPTHTLNSTWRDVKVYNNYAFIVSEANAHGMQIFDLTELRDVVSIPFTFSETAYYNGFGKAHNIVINEESGFAYGVGTNTQSGGLHAVNISDPLNPVFAGGFPDDGYTHDAQVVNYIGPDTDYTNAEIAFACNENSLTIVDVSIKNDMTQISRNTYAGSFYAHQGWLTPDHKYFLLDDELDEWNTGNPTKTYVWDVQDLDNPILIGTHSSTINAIDHNQYVHNGYTFQANYKGGLRMLSLDNISLGTLNEVGFFDSFPSSNTAGFDGLWGVYPYFESGVIALSGIDEGLFLVKPNFTFLELIEESCGTMDVVYRAKVKSGFTGPVSISVSGLPTNTSFSVTNNNIMAGDSTDVIISQTGFVNPGNYEITIHYNGLNSQFKEVTTLIYYPFDAPDGLNAEFAGNGYNLTWNPVPGSIACKVRGRKLGGINFTSSGVFYSDEPTFFFAPLSAVQSGQTYEWQVICGCSVNPIIATPWSALSLFTVPEFFSTDDEKTIADNEIRIFPNPAAEFISIQGKWRLNSEIVIFNSLGQAVISKKLTSKDNITLNINSLAPGSYILYFKDESKSIRFIK